MIRKLIGEHVPSVVQDDIRLITVVDEEGNVSSTFSKYDPSSVSYGCVGDWSLNSLISAGINPSTLNLSTNNRLNKFDEFSDFEAYADSIMRDVIIETPQVDSNENNN
ncbi:hypothetical protein [Capybara microvirus Cap3_SP_363]|nr:hypothetical protein [Capybara microvirus Cap3_SP_363]